MLFVFISFSTKASDKLEKVSQKSLLFELKTSVTASKQTNQFRNCKDHSFMNIKMVS